MKRMEMSPYGYPIVYFCVLVKRYSTCSTHLPEANVLFRTLGTHLPEANALVGIFGACTFFVKNVIRYDHSPSHSKKRMRRYIRPPNNRTIIPLIADHYT